MISRARKRTHAVALLVGSIVISSTLACSAVLGIGDWPSGEAETNDAAKPDVVSKPDAPSAKETGTGSEAGHGRDATADVTLHDAGSDVVNDATRDADAHDAGVEAEASEGGAPVVTVSPSTLLFGNVPAGDGGRTSFARCGTSPAPQTITITPPSTSIVTYWTAFASGASSLYKLSVNCTQAQPCLISSGSAAIIVTPPPVSPTAGIATFNDSLAIITSAPGDPGHTVQLNEASYGAILQLSPQDENFGSQPVSGSYAQTVQVLNSGNAPLGDASFRLADGSSPEFAATLAGVDGSTGPAASSIRVPLDGGASFKTWFTPKDVDAAAGAVAVRVPADSICAPLPANLTLEGQGSAGQISVAPSSLNFNQGQNGGVGVSCGSQVPYTLNASVTNTGGAAATITSITLGLGASSPFTVASSALPATVAPGATYSIAVTSRPISSDAGPGINLNDTLTILTQDTTGDAGQTPHTVALNESWAGVILSVAPASITFSSTSENTTSTLPLSITNSGNIAAPVTLTAPTGEPFTFGPLSTVAPNSTVNVNAIFMPTTPGPYPVTGTANGMVAVAAGTPLCGGFNGTIDVPMSGTATLVNYYSANVTNLAFGNNTCAAVNATGPGTPPSAQMITLSNTSSTSAPWTASIAGSDPSFFPLSASSGSIPPEAGGVPGTAILAVSPIGLFSGSGLTASEMQNGLSGTVTITVGAGSNVETFTIPVTETPVGAFPSWSPNPLPITTTYSPGLFTIGASTSGSATFYLVNAASAQTTFSLSASPASAFSLNTTKGASSAATSLKSTATYEASGKVQTAMGAVTATVAAGTPLCGPLLALPVTATLQ